MESNNLDQLAMDAIKENLELAEIAIKTPRQEGSDSCYGNSALLLLSSVLDAIGSFYNHKDNKGQFVSLGSKSNLKEREGAKEHFNHVYNYYIKNMENNCGYTSEDMFIKDFYENFRCGVTHNAVFSDGKLVMHNSTDVSKKILNVNDLLEMVKKVKDKFYNDHLDVFAVGETVEGPITGNTGTTAFTSTQANAGLS